MAAYAALVSLLNNLEQIRNQPRFFASFDNDQIESLGEKIDFFLDFLESCNSYGGVSKEEAEELESHIASAAHEAEDVIESYVVDQIVPRSIKIISHLRQSCLFDLQKVILDMDSIKIRVLKVKEERGFNDHKPTNPMPAASSTPLTTGKSSSMVGFDDELMQLKDVLTGQQPSRQIISIVGMGGTGKTTLARNVYEDSLTVHHFDLRAWATISQEYNVRDILLQLLSIPEKLTNETVDDLGFKLYQSLVGRRYLIILDDMWCVEVWDRIKFYFPDNSDGSRVVLTTRLSNVAAHLRSFCIRINFLDEHKSWDLFCQKVFGQEDCPLELVDTGKKIVEQCKGLPLTIVVIGGLLRNSFRIEEYWQNVAKNINSVLNSRENGECLDILYLSYSHLPAHLKPCFLYMGTFKEDREIRVSEMIRLWVAEGFLKPIGAQILEEIAEDYLKDLIDRNLILVCAHRPNGKIRSCRIHDLLRELCIRVANKEKFFCVMRAHSIPQGINFERRLIIHDKTSSNHSIEVSEALQSASLSRSVICSIPLLSAKCRLLRVLNKAFSPDLKCAFQNVNLRYIDYQSYYFRHACMLHNSITMLWNLQTLIVRGSNQLIVPLEIWWMPQLRHLKCSRISLPDPPPSDEDDDYIILKNLQTLKRVSNFRLSEEACKRIPNIKKLCIRYSDMQKGYDRRLYDNLQILGGLHKLESLNIWCSERISANELKKAFPSSLNKLSLGGCIVHWEDLSMISGSLPLLEVLKLNVLSCKERKWNCVEGGFLRLKFLSIVSCDLNSWTLGSASYFPVLEKLVLIYLSELEEIPSGFGQVSTLQLIRLEYCSESVAISAMKIKEEQVIFGNEDLQVQVVNEVHSDKASKRWNFLVCVLRWWLSIKRCVARKSSVGAIPPCHDAQDVSSPDLLFDETDSMDWWDLSWTSPGQVSDNSIRDTGSMDLAFSAIDFKYTDADFSTSKQWNLLFWVLRWRISIKRIVARKNRGAGSLFVENDSREWWDLPWMFHTESMAPSFSANENLECIEEELNENDPMDWSDDAWTFPGQVSNYSIHDTESMDRAFSATEYFKYIEAEFSPNLGTSKQWDLLFWVLRWWISIKRIVARKNRGAQDISSRGSFFVEIDSSEWWDLPWMFHTESMAPSFSGNENLECIEAEVNANDPMDWSDHAWTFPGQVSDNSICDTGSMASAFSATEYMKYIEAEFSRNLGTFFPCSIPIDPATKQWNVLFWLLRWRFSIKRIMARKNRGKKPLLMGDEFRVPE